MGVSLPSPSASPRLRAVRASSRLLLAGSLVAGLWASAPAARGSDLDDVRARAQAVADRVSALEHRLARLRARRSELATDIAVASRRLGLAELRLGDLRRHFESARGRYVRRAVEIYKDGPLTRLALVLSANDPGALFDIAEAASRAAEADRASLQTMAEVVRTRARAQATVDERKQRLLAAQAEVEALRSRVESALAERRAVLADLDEQVRRLEQLARLRALRAAAAGADIGAAFAELLRPTGPAEHIPDGYVGTGISFEGIASWYGPGFAGQDTANGQVFDPHLYTAASRDLAFGTLLYVTFEGKGVVVVINDRGPYIKNRILDLSRAAAEAIGLGLGWVRAEILVTDPS